MLVCLAVCKAQSLAEWDQAGIDGSNVLLYRNIASKDDWPTRPGIKTLYDQFEESVKRASHQNCLGWRPIQGGKAGPFQWFSYKETQSGYPVKD